MSKSRITFQVVGTFTEIFKFLFVIKFTVYYFRANLNNLVHLKTNIVLEDEALL